MNGQERNEEEIRMEKTKFELQRLIAELGYEEDEKTKALRPGAIEALKQYDTESQSLPDPAIEIMGQYNDMAIQHIEKILKKDLIQRLQKLIDEYMVVASQLAEEANHPVSLEESNRVRKKYDEILPKLIEELKNRGLSDQVKKFEGDQVTVLKRFIERVYSQENWREKDIQIQIGLTVDNLLMLIDAGLENSKWFQVSIEQAIANIYRANESFPASEGENIFTKTENTLYDLADSIGLEIDLEGY